jgi:alkaline phosphatase
MIEGSHIDKESHANDIHGMLEQLVAFDKAVGFVLAANIPDTYVFVTADHETGNLLYSGETKEQLNDKMYRSQGHTNQMVRYFASYQIVNLPDVIDSTNISSIFRQLIGL